MEMIITLILSICITLGIAFFNRWFKIKHVLKIVLLFCTVLLVVSLLAFFLGQLWGGYNGSLHQKLG